ncbi:SecD/SecF fusion protein [Ereboglobus sp. PH5-5]|uniref:protein translocase subunit SecD n=1 Tax=unclassified Ereboglobus TaxID=2626932 RepID=UPI0024058C52|nr:MULTISPECIES: protein translocase subunit SecD [unclassified Ereboglobus]MDF9826984.1 SecD/SecF fusion protein [Ereboglobus sp. PH5-10]MDF9832006.1 SecD/SecF fusion protein [Ereboglobus sp. PH5-5]
MIKRNLWKIIISLAVVVFCATSLVPLKDQEFIDFVKLEASAKQSEFNALMKEAVELKDKGRARTAYLGLKQLAGDRKIDLQKEYFPDIDVGRSKNPDTKNEILLKHLLKSSKAKLQLGLDLKGGVAFTLELDAKAIADLDRDARADKLKKAQEIIEKRINSFGVTEPIIRAVGDTRLEVQLPGVNTKDDPGVVDSLQKPAMLEFRLVHPFVYPTGQPGEQIPAGYEKMTSAENDDGGTVDLFVQRRPLADGKIIKRAYASLDQWNRPQINMEFTDTGRVKFAEITREVARYSKQLQQQSGNHEARASMAIVLDGKLQSYPGVKDEIDSNGAEITGRFTTMEAQNLAAVLNNPLDVPMHVREQYEIGPSLAEDAISSGLRASIIGAALVAAFMIMFYSSGGLLAVIMLGINVVIIFGVMANFNATLTLPGLAGIVLTIGMAVDANILIFERMREEIREGKSLSAANHAGFMKALWTILDAHFVQLLICAVMIIYGSGPIKGFGVTLAIGVCSTLFSVLITGHMLLELLVDGGVLKKITMRHLLRKAPHWDFVKWGWKALIASWLIVAIGVGGIIYTGKAIYGIDFAGGDSVSLKFNKDKKVDTGAIRAAATGAGIGEIMPAYVKDIGSDNEILRVDTTYNNAPKLVSALQAKFPEANFQSLGVSSVGPSIGNEILWKAITAIAIAMLVTLLYIAFRFELGFGIGAMFSSAHDVLMTVGVFVIIGHGFLGFQFTAPMVAGILAITGYSINETVVVFDRIREELRINMTGSLKDIVNTAINKVFARTIMTSTTTLLASLSLFIFGSGVLKEIAFTFTVGIITSTFSAIFISSQVFYWYHRGDRKRVEKHQDVKPTYEWTGASKASE